MFFLTIVHDYLTWHYTTALISFVRIYKNFWWFLTQFFSLPQLLTSLFAPYKRMTERRGKLLDMEGWLEYFTINLLSRLLGLVARLTIIISGVLSLSVFSLVAAIWYAIFIIAPILVALCFSYGLYLLF
ncbi:MAG: hypothetical protein V4606_02170 [Patescibacteria group bacterium]